MYTCCSIVRLEPSPKTPLLPDSRTVVRFQHDYCYTAEEEGGETTPVSTEQEEKKEAGPVAKYRDARPAATTTAAAAHALSSVTSGSL